MIPASPMGRRQAVRLLLLALALALTLAACAPDEGTGSGDTGGTVKVGFISPVTGFVAALGTDMRRGWEMYWQQNGAKVGDVTVQTVFEDDTGDPDVALTKARRLVEQEQVQLVAGPILANTAYAVAGYVAGRGLPTLQMTGADDLTQRRFDPHVLRVGYTSSQSNFPAGKWAHDQGHRTAVTICPDYAFGWESCGGFVSAFVGAGGTIKKQVWHPLGTQDFSTYVGQARQANPDVVFIGSAGGPDAILFYKAWTGFGLKDKIPPHRELLLRRPGVPARGRRRGPRPEELHLLVGGPRLRGGPSLRPGLRAAAQGDPLVVRRGGLHDGPGRRRGAQEDRRQDRGRRLHQRGQAGVAVGQPLRRADLQRHQQRGGAGLPDARREAGRRDAVERGGEHPSRR